MIATALMKVPRMKTLPLIAALAATITVSLPAMAQRSQPNPFSERLARLSPMQQKAVLRRAVLDSGQICRRPDAVAHRGPYRNLEMWTVSCTPGGAYAVFIGTDQSVQVRQCGEMAKLRLPACAGAVPPNRTR